jgi:Xaa-Pro aminopeptidase
LRVLKEADSTHKFTIIIPNPSDYIEFINISKNVSLVAFPIASKQWLLPFTNEFLLPRFLEEKKCDIVFNLSDLPIPTSKLQLFLFDWSYAAFPDSIAWKLGSTSDKLKRKFKLYIFKKNFSYIDVVIAQGEALSNKDVFELVKIREMLAPLRSVKDDYEIKQIKKACAITADTLWFLINDLRPGMNERQISNLLQEGFLKRGADGLAFASIVASGENSATPHHEPTKRILERGDMVTIDCGALVNGYHADMTRTVFIGTCADWQKDIYDLVMKAQEAGRKKLIAGAIAEEVDEATRKIIRDANYGDFFVHGTGHGVGLEIHEPVFIAKDVKTKLSSGSCITVEPGIYLPGKGGVRIEDTCLVTEGEAEVLTPGSHEIICVA